MKRYNSGIQVFGGEFKATNVHVGGNIVVQGGAPGPGDEILAILDDIVQRFPRDDHRLSALEAQAAEMRKELSNTPARKSRLASILDVTDRIIGLGDKAAKLTQLVGLL